MLVAVQSVSCVWHFATPWTAAHQASLSFTISWSLLTLMLIESVMPSSHLILCHPLLLLPSIFPSIRVYFSSLLCGSGDFIYRHRYCSSGEVACPRPHSHFPWLHSTSPSIFPGCLPLAFGLPHQMMPGLAPQVSGHLGLAGKWSVATDGLGPLLGRAGSPEGSQSCLGSSHRGITRLRSRP